MRTWPPRSSSAPPPLLLQFQRCGSTWALFRQIDGSAVELAAGQCCIDQKGLLPILSLDCHPTGIVVCVDNRSALTSENPTGSEFARNIPLTIHHLRDNGWSAKGLWTPAHCRIPGNKRADGGPGTQGVWTYEGYQNLATGQSPPPDDRMNRQVPCRTTFPNCTLHGFPKSPAEI